MINPAKLGVTTMTIVTQDVQFMDDHQRQPRSSIRQLKAENEPMQKGSILNWTTIGRVCWFLDFMYLEKWYCRIIAVNNLQGNAGIAPAPNHSAWPPRLIGYPQDQPPSDPLTDFYTFKVPWKDGQDQSKLGESSNIMHRFFHFPCFCREAQRICAQ